MNTKKVVFDQPFATRAAQLHKRVGAKRLGQISIQFIGGLFIFISVVVYIAFSVIRASGDYHEKIDENVLRQEAWVLSNYIATNVSSGLEISQTKINSYLGKCKPLNGTDHQNVKTAFGVPLERSFRLTISKNPVPLTTTQVGNTFAGNLSIEGILCDFTNSKSAGSSFFDRTTIVCSGTSINLQEGNVKRINGADYTIDKIDPEGQFAVLTNKTVDCGLSIPLEGSTVVSIDRFMQYNGHLGAIKLLFW